MTMARMSLILCATLDGKYLDTFGRGQYQGVTRDHYVEIDLGDDAPVSGPLYLNCPRLDASDRFFGQCCDRAGPSRRRQGIES